MESAATAARHRSRLILVQALAPKEVGGRIALARLEAGLTQDQLSELGTFSRRALQSWEAGEHIPYRSIRELSSLLNRPVEWFLHGELPAVPLESGAGLESRLAELVEAVSVLARQMTEAREAFLVQLEAIERRLPPPTASEPPIAAGTGVADEVA